MIKHPIFTKTVIAILCITALAIVAMLQGIDGYIFFTACAAIAGLGGFIVGKATKPK